jgi:hypothetical protein
MKALLLGRSLIYLLLGWLCPPTIVAPKDNLGCADVYDLLHQHARNQEDILRADGVDPLVVMRRFGAAGVLISSVGAFCQIEWMFMLGLIVALPVSVILYAFFAAAPAFSHCFYRAAALSKIGLSLSMSGCTRAERRGRESAKARQTKRFQAPAEGAI